MENALLTLGLLFPAVSWITLLASSIQQLTRGLSSSGVYIPFIGPVLLDIWLVLLGAPTWTLSIPWIADIGTVLFLWVFPRLVSDIWSTSRFTRTFLFVGTMGSQIVEISMHNGGRYVMTRKWNRPMNELGVTALNEPGTFESHDDEITLTSHTGWVRQLSKRGDEITVADSEAEGDYQIDGWTLYNQRA